MSVRPSTGVAFDLLRRHVVRRAEELAGRGEVRAAGGDLGDAEVGDLRAVAFEEDDVRRLHVAMHDALRVREIERLGDLRADVGDLLERQRASLRQHFFEVLPSTYSMAMNDMPAASS